MICVLLNSFFSSVPEANAAEDLSMKQVWFEAKSSGQHNTFYFENLLNKV